MKKSTKILIGIAVLIVVGAAVYYVSTKDQKETTV